jgi:hypothetical protein
MQRVELLAPLIRNPPPIRERIDHLEADVVPRLAIFGSRIPQPNDQSQINNPK